MPLHQLETLSFKELEGLLESGLEESKYLDFKRQPYAPTDGERNELCKDITALANTNGGYLVIGVSEPQGNPQRRLVKPVVGETVDSLKGRFEQTLSSRVKPSLRVEFTPIYVDESNTDLGYVMIIRVPQTLALPHMRLHNDSTKFFVRTSHGVETVTDIYQLRDLFLQSENTETKINEWLATRLDLIQGGGLDFEMRSSSSFVLHIISLPNFLRRIPIVMPTASEMPLAFGQWGSKGINAEGRYLIAPNSGQARAYVQFFRTGKIEALFCDLRFRWTPQDVERIHLISAEGAIFEGLERYVDSLIKAGAEVPMLITASLINCHAAYPPLPRYEVKEKVVPPKKPRLRLPFLLWEGGQEDLHTFLKPMMDAMWNAYGIEESPGYVDGLWAQDNYNRCSPF